MTDEINIQIKFEIIEDGLSFRDALNLTQEEYAAIDEREIEIRKRERFDKWKTFIDEQSQPKPKIEEKARVEANITALDEQKAAYQAELVALNK